MSQAGQDDFVLAILKNKRNGCFLELGASDAVQISNTYLLEKEFGWTGLMIEGDVTNEASYKKHRTSKYIINDALNVDYKSELSSFPREIDYLQIDLEPVNGSTILALELLEQTVFSDHTFSVVTFEHDSYREETFNTRERSRAIFDAAGYVRVFGDVRMGASPFEDWYVYPASVDMTFVEKIMTSESLDFHDIAARCLSAIHS